MAELFSSWEPVFSMGERGPCRDDAARYSSNRGSAGASSSQSPVFQFPVELLQYHQNKSVEVGVSMPKEQIAIGAIVAVLCLAGAWKERWLLEHSKYGHRLIGWFGPQRAPWVLRCLLCGGIVFGVLLATNVIHPVRWQSD